jgi:hypothetical protein
MVQVGVFGGELTVSLVGLIFRVTSIMGSNTGTVADLEEVRAPGPCRQACPASCHTAAEAGRQCRHAAIT